ncbi:putative cytochrome c oxidase subunit VA [Thermoascus aurantiacus ATCC 26904]
MSSTALFRIATRSVRPSTFFKTSYSVRSPVQSLAGASMPVALGFAGNFSTTSKRFSAGHEEETYEEFSARYEKEFENVQDVFELQIPDPPNLHLANARCSSQRNLNNCFAYDLVPSVEVLAAALRAARRVNDFPTAVRIFEGIKAKVENEAQYQQYLEKLDGLRKELGVALREELYPEEE